jgi:hypothetical protein
MPPLERPREHGSATHASASTVKCLVIGKILPMRGKPHPFQLADGACGTVQSGHLGHDGEDGYDCVKGQRPPVGNSLSVIAPKNVHHRS